MSIFLIHIFLSSFSGESKTTVAPFVLGGVSDGQWHSVQLHYYNKVRHCHVCHSSSSHSFFFCFPLLSLKDRRLSESLTLITLNKSSFSQTSTPKGDNVLARDSTMMSKCTHQHVSAHIARCKSKIVSSVPCDRLRKTIH